MSASEHTFRFLFCHVPKAGGTTMGRILRRNFGKAFYPYYGIYDHYPFSARDIAGMCDLHPHFTCIASHLFSLDIPFEHPRWDFRALSFVRDPVERALSLFFYSVHLAEKSPGGPHPGTIEEFFEPILSGKKQDRRFFDAQTNFLARRDPAGLDLARVETLVEADQLVLAPLDRFDDTCLLLENLFPTHFRDTAYPALENRAPRSQEVPDKLRERLRDANPMDSLLHQTAMRVFENQFGRVLGAKADAAREEFVRRGEALREDWVEEENREALNEEERALLVHLKKENRELKEEIRRLESVPFTNLAPPLRMKHVSAILRRLSSGDRGQDVNG